jgi:hypothetical protein
MKRTTIVTGLLMISAIGGLMLWGRAGNDASGPQARAAVRSDLSAAKATHDFGVISMRDGNVSYVLTVANATDAAITVDRVSTSCMCTTAYIDSGTSHAGPFGMPGMGLTKANSVFAAGQSMNIEVVFDPNAHGPAGVGPMQRFVDLTDTGGGVLQLQIRGTVRP